MGSLAHRAPSAACCGRVMQYSTNICRAASRVGDPTSLLRSGVAKATEPRFAREAGTGDAVDLDGNVSARHGGSASPSWKPWASAEFLPEKTKEQEGQAWVHFVGELALVASILGIQSFLRLLLSTPAAPSGPLRRCPLHIESSELCHGSTSRVLWAVSEGFSCVLSCINLDDILYCVRRE